MEKCKTVWNNMQNMLGLIRNTEYMNPPNLSSGVQHGYDKAAGRKMSQNMQKEILRKIAKQIR